MTQYNLTITKTVPAPIQVAFDAWLNADALKKFMTPMPGMSVPKAEADGKVGGAFLVVMQAGDKEMPHHGTYKTINKYSKLAFTWNNPFSPDETIVELTFEEKGPGETQLTLHHKGLPSEESRENHNDGWTHIVDALVNQLNT